MKFFACLFLTLVLFCFNIFAQGFVTIPIKEKVDKNIIKINIEELVDTLIHLDSSNTIETVAFLKTINSSNTNYDLFLPIKSNKIAKNFWGIREIHALTSANTTVNNKVFSSNLEIFSDIVSVLKLSLGLSLASNSSKDSTDSTNQKQSTITRLIQSGGAVNFSAIYPFLFISHNLDKYDDESGLLTSIIRVSIGWDSPKLDEFIDNPGVSGTIGLELSGYYTGTNLGVDFGFSFNEHYFNSHYQERLEINKEWGNIILYKFGVIIARKTRLGITGSISGSNFLKEFYGLRAYLTQTIGF